MQILSDPDVDNLLYIALLEWRSNEITNRLPITNSGFACLKPLGGFMIRTIKRISRTPGDLVCKSLRQMAVQGWGIWI